MQQRIYQVIMRRVGSLFGHCCAYCGCHSDHILCESCLSTIKTVDCSCVHCAAILEAASQNNLCKNCLESPPHFDSATAFYQYDGIIAELIIRAKLSKDISAISALIFLLKRAIDQNNYNISNPILAVPTPRVRLMIRGFNLPELLLNKTELRKYKVSSSVVTLPFYVKKQSKLGLLKRQANQHDYQIRQNLATHVTIFDDVLTTGNTVSELAVQLKDNGVKRVDVCTFARGVLN